MSFSIPVNYIRQWCFCPRIVYYAELTDFPARYPVWVRQGEIFHEQEARLWQRRTLSRFGLQDAAVHLDFQGKSEKHGLHGIADMLIESGDEVFPVEFKLTWNFQKKGGLLQLAAYGLIAAEQTGKKCQCGFIAESEKKLHRVNFSDQLTGEVLQKAAEIRNMLIKGTKPVSPATLRQCTNCEFLNHCNDRD